MVFAQKGKSFALSLGVLKRSLFITFCHTHACLVKQALIKRSICRESNSGGGESFYCKFRFLALAFIEICKLCTDIQLYYLE